MLSYIKLFFGIFALLFAVAVLIAVFVVTISFFGSGETTKGFVMTFILLVYISGAATIIIRAGGQEQQ